MCKIGRVIIFWCILCSPYDLSLSLIYQAAEDYLVNLFERSILCAIHAKRVTLSKFYTFSLCLNQLQCAQLLLIYAKVYEGWNFTSRQFSNHCFLLILSFPAHYYIIFRIHEFGLITHSLGAFYLFAFISRTYYSFWNPLGISWSLKGSLFLLEFLSVKKDFELARRIGGIGQPWWSISPYLYGRKLSRFGKYSS